MLNILILVTFIIYACLVSLVNLLSYVLILCLCYALHTLMALLAFAALLAKHSYKFIQSSTVNAKFTPYRKLSYHQIEIFKIFILF